MNTAAEVNVRFAEDGTPQVISFTWERQRLTVTAGGRTWLDDAGRHVLVMVPGDRVFELLLRRSDLMWCVVGVSSRPSRFFA